MGCRIYMLGIMITTGNGYFTISKDNNDNRFKEESPPQINECNPRRERRGENSILPWCPTCVPNVLPLSSSHPRLTRSSSDPSRVW